MMDDHLLDEIFARFDPECSGKVRCYRARRKTWLKHKLLYLQIFNIHP